MILYKLTDILERIKAISLKEFDNDFFNLQLKIENLKLDKKIDKLEIIPEISELIFQLEDYKFTLTNFVRMLLVNQEFVALFRFVSKIFTSHVGSIPYQSTGRAYSYKERYFDRFIEIVKFTSIDKAEYIPFVLAIVDSDNELAVFKDIAIEFLHDFFNKNEEWVNKNIINYGTSLLGAVLVFNTAKGLKMLLNCKNDENSIHLMKLYKKEILLYIDKSITVSEIEPYLDILFLFINDTEVKTRLKHVYDVTDNEKIKEKISYKLGITESLSIRSLKQFVIAAKRKMKEPNERVLGIAFDTLGLKTSDGALAANETISFLLFLFKEEKNLMNLKSMLSLKPFFEEESLNTFINKLYLVLFKMDDIKAAKWCVRLVCLYASEALLKSLKNKVLELFESNRTKEGHYLLTCLIFSQRNVLEIIRNLKDKNLIDDEHVEEYSKLLSSNAKISLEEIKDELTVHYENEEEVKQRFFKAYLSARKFEPEFFDNVIMKNVALKNVAKGLVFGEYKFGRVYNAFVIDEDTKKYVVGKPVDEGEFAISILHSLDIDDRFEDVKFAIKQPLFNQFKNYCYSVKDYTAVSVYVSRFNGTMVNASKFFISLEMFKPNKTENEKTFDSLINVMESMEIVAILDVQIMGDIATIGNISFYRFSDVTFDNGKCLPNRENPMAIGAIPYRYFDYVMDSIRLAALSPRK